MDFFITATIRAFVAREHRLSFSSRRWRRTVAELNRRGRRRHEAGVFLLGTERDGRKQVLDTVFYDDLDSQAYESGVCILHGDSFARLWTICREKGLTVVADVHTHGGAALQSTADKANPMVAHPGHIAIIVPDFAHWPIEPTSLGIYEYRGNHEWFDRGATKAPGYFYTGIWG